MCSSFKNERIILQEQQKLFRNYVSTSAKRFADFATYYVMNHPIVIIAARSDTAFCAVIYLRKQESGATCVYEAGRVECTVLYSYVLIAIVSPSRRWQVTDTGNI